MFHKLFRTVEKFAEVCFPVWELCKIFNSTTQWKFHLLLYIVSLLRSHGRKDNLTSNWICKWIKSKQNYEISYIARSIILELSLLKWGNRTALINISICDHRIFKSVTHTFHIFESQPHTWLTVFISNCLHWQSSPESTVLTFTTNFLSCWAAACSR